MFSTFSDHFIFSIDNSQYRPEIVVQLGKVFDLSIVQIQIKFIALAQLSCRND